MEFGVMVANAAGILTDGAIAAAVACGDIEIDPYDSKHLNPASYDLTLGDEVLVYSFDDQRAHDVREMPFTKKRYIDDSGIILRPGDGYLMHTRERVWTGKYVPVLDGKSSIGRLFISVHFTAGYGDPGFNGQYTLEVTTLYPVRLYAGMRIAQMRFHTTCGTVQKPYAGQYQGETAKGPVASRAWRQFR